MTIHAFHFELRGATMFIGYATFIQPRLVDSSKASERPPTKLVRRLADWVSADLSYEEFSISLGRVWKDELSEPLSPSLSMMARR